VYACISTYFFTRIHVSRNRDVESSPTSPSSSGMQLATQDSGGGAGGGEYRLPTYLFSIFSEDPPQKRLSAEGEEGEKTKKREALESHCRGREREKERVSREIEIGSEGRTWGQPRRKNEQEKHLLPANSKSSYHHHTHTPRVSRSSLQSRPGENRVRNSN